MPFVDRELVVTLMGAERAELVVGTGARTRASRRAGRPPRAPRARRGVPGPASSDGDAGRGRGGASRPRGRTTRSQKEPDAAFDLAHRLGVPSDIDRLLIDTMDELLNSARLPTLETWASRAVRLVGETPAVLVAQAEIALRRGRHLTAQALADRAAQGRTGQQPCPVSRAPCRRSSSAHRPA